MDSSDDSQQDIFADTQIPTKNSHVSESNPHKWENTNFEYPMLVLFLWNGQKNPFVLVYLIELDPQDVGEKWMSAILSPASRAKHRNLKMFPEFGVSVFSKIHKSKNYYLDDYGPFFMYFIYFLNLTYQGMTSTERLGLWTS